MKVAYQVALQSTIFLLFWAVMPFLGDATELATGAQKVTTAGIFFEMPDSYRLLQELESCRDEKEQNLLLLRLNQKNEQLDEIRKEREVLFRERIGFLEAQQKELLQMNDASLKTMEMVRKASGGSWWEKALTAGKWIGLGILVGFVAGAGK